MNILLCPFVVIILTVFPLTSCQDPVPIQFQTSPVLVATGNNAVFTVQTISSIFSITWIAPSGSTLGQWINSQAVLNPTAQYQGRVTISATQLIISGSQLSDAGSYTVTVTPSGPTGLATNSRSVTLSVFVAVGTVSLIVPSVVIEGGNTSLTCSWTSGTNTTVTWGKGSTNLPSDPRYVVNAGSLVISPVNRNDAGQYSCTVSNPVSSQTATASLTVYYGPDTPQLTKTSSNCVGGGDATIGQTVQLTCTSVSLPPALLSWQFNGLPLTASQTSGQTLNLQIFSTNQSGQYTCSARNSVTTQTSQQQISLSVVGTCLSVGAVAGIVVACFVALVLIIVAIILILRQRNVNQRLRTVMGQQKENNRPPVLQAPRDGHDNPNYLGQGDQPDPPMQNTNRLNRPKNQQTNDQQNNNDILIQNRANNTSVVRPSDNLNADMFSNNANLTSSAYLPNAQRNGHLNQHNTASFQPMGQQNPNILIQTSHSEPGPNTVLINLNTLPQHQNATIQPHSVQVSLNAPQPSTGQPNQTTMHYNDQQSNTINQELANTSRSNPHHVSGSHSNPQTRMDTIRNTAQPAHNSTSRNGQSRDHRGTNQRRSGQNIENTYPYREPTRTQLGRTHSISVDDSDANTRPHQMPWDRMHGTPAYPNPEVDSYASQRSAPQNSSSDSESENSAPAQRLRRSTADEPVRNISRASRRNLLRQLAHSAAYSRSRQDRHMAKQNAQPRVIASPRADHQSQTAPQNTASQRHGLDIMDVAVPQNQAVQMQTAQPTPLRQTVPDQRQTGPLNAATPNNLMLTQAVLQQHTNQTPNPFVNRIQQTQDALQHPNQQTQPALQHPGTQLTPAQTAPRQIDLAGQAGQAAPAPPPVLRLAEFKSLPREHLPKPLAVKPVPVTRRPVALHHGQRPANMPRHARTIRNNLHRHPTNTLMHAGAHKHGNPQGLPVHISQVHRSRHRP